MFLERLELQGFKSFVDKTTVLFGDGITGVVGPNGCGKTNVSDAIRWVMGEQSAKQLRGDSMEDVIFNGAPGRKPVGLAEVHLTFRNDRGILPTEFSEVTISRRVFRSGLSEYFINKTPCRLKDVRDLFFDTGMGSHAYSVIERQMVDHVLSDNSGHRRFLFEEASGITKYKARKRETLNKLEATEGDLTRLNDIVFEIERGLRDREEARRGAEHQVVLLRERAAGLERRGTEAGEEAAAMRERLAEAARNESESAEQRGEARGERETAQKAAEAREAELAAVEAELRERRSVVADKKQLSLDLFSTEAEKRGACERIREREKLLRERLEATRE